MAQIPTEEELQKFALNFDNEIMRPLVNAGFAKYNIFDILNINRQELRHSDFLAFLLDPSKSGDIGWQFLRSFLVSLAKDIVSKQLDFFTILYGNIENVSVRREVAVKDGRIDILIELEITKEKLQKIVIAIENKVDSGEQNNQLERYKDYLLGEKYKEHTKVMLYLSPDKETSTNNTWIKIDYEFIYKTLNRVDTKAADNTIKMLVNDYKETIRREFAMQIDDELKQKAMEIYRNPTNRKVIDFIYANKPDWRREVAKNICKYLELKGATIVTQNNKGVLVESDKKDTVNIMFIIDELEKYPNHYFQIWVDGMVLLFKENLTNNSTRQPHKRQHLLGKGLRIEEIKEKYEELVLSDTKELEDDCKQIVEQIFEPNGAIAKALATL